MKVLVTGSVGFIGAATSKRLLDMGYEVIGVDNFNNYYDPALKYYRLEQLTPYKNFKQIKMDLADRDGISKLFNTEKFQRVIHLGAQAGVRHSIEAPFEYIDSNLIGMMTVLEGCRHNNVEHLVYASSSSVYGMNTKVPFSEEDRVDHPVSLYAATKKSNELMAHSYSHLYGLPTTGLRFFTVYGPAGRPDMAPWLFTEAILKNKEIKVYNNGEMQRDFTYIDDITENILRIQDPATFKQIENDKHNIPAPNYRIFNIGNNNPIKLMDFIEAIEKACEKKAKKLMFPMQLGDVQRTYADLEALIAVTNLTPQTGIEKGMKLFVDWYQEYSSFKAQY